jgi:hypothetical protein
MFFRPGAVLALTILASPVVAGQERSAPGDVSGDRIASFRVDFNKVMDHYGSVLSKLGHARGVGLTVQAREGLRAVSDEQLARVFATGRVKDLSDAVEAAARLDVLTVPRGETGRIFTPGFPNAPPILAACDDILHDPEWTFGVLVAHQILRTVLAVAEFACGQTVVVLGEGGNTSAVCIPFSIAKDAAEIPFELADFCGGEEDSAIGQGSYDRLEHIHLDVEVARADILTSIEVHTQMIITNDNTNRDLIIANDNANRDQIIQTLKNLTCDLNRLVHTPEGQRKSDIVECQGQPAFPFDFPEH